LAGLLISLWFVQTELWFILALYDNLTIGGKGFSRENCRREREVALFQNGVCLWKNCESSVGASRHSPQISLAAIAPFGENPAPS
jgi:hypothetical protein